MKLYVTYCSGNKKEKDAHPPEDLYISHSIDRFVDKSKENGWNWAILSAEHGLFFPDQKHTPYDTTFRTRNYICRTVRNEEFLKKEESQRHIEKLVEGIQRDFSTRNYEELSYSAPTPQRANSNQQ